MDNRNYLHSTERIQFTIPDHSGSGMSYEGILKISSEGLTMEYAEKSESCSINCSSIPFKKWANKNLGFEFELDEGNGIKQIGLNFGQLDFLKRRNFVFFSTILISTDSLRTFRSIPAQKQGRLTIYCSMRQHQNVAKFVSAFNMLLADWRMKSAEEELEKTRRFKAL